MDNRTNIIAMMGLGAAIVALGSTIVASEIFTSPEPAKKGYIVEGVEADNSGGGAQDISIAALLPTADPAKGAEVFKKCAACHTINPGGPNGVGPNLYGVVGKPHGHLANFAYSDALKSKPGNWNFDELNQWLHSPKTYAPGTKMTFAGLSKNEDRANVIAYLNQQGSNLPIPPAPAAGAAPAAKGAPAADNATGPAKAGGNVTSPAPEVGPAAAGNNDVAKANSGTGGPPR